MDLNNEYLLKGTESFGTVSFDCQEYKNIFIPSGKISIKNESISFLGDWKKKEETYIPEKLEFYLIFDDYNKTKCTLTKKNKNAMICEGNNYGPFTQQFINKKLEYLVRGVKRFLLNHLQVQVLLAQLFFISIFYFYSS